MIAFALQEDSTELTSRVWPRIRLMWLFSEGPPAEAVLESDLIELPGLVTLGAVRWEAEAPPGSEVQIRTRTGGPASRAHPLLRQDRQRKDQVPAQKTVLYPERPYRHVERGRAGMERLEQEVRAFRRSGHLARAAPFPEDPGAPRQSRPQGGAGH